MARPSRCSSSPHVASQRWHVRYSVRVVAPLVVMNRGYDGIGWSREGWVNARLGSARREVGSSYGRTQGAFANAGDTIVTDTDPMLFDPMQDGVPADPYPLYDRLRREDPVHRSSTGRLLLTRYADCWSVLRDPAMSTAQRPATSDSDVAQLLAAYLSNLMLFNDPPDHTRLRGLVNKAFTPSVIERLRP